MDAPDVYAVRSELRGSLRVFLPKATVIRQETRTMCEKQLISSHWFAEHLEQCCTQNSERLLRTPVYEKKTGRERSQALERAAYSVDRCAED